MFCCTGRARWCELDAGRKILEEMDVRCEMICLVRRCGLAQELACREGFSSEPDTLLDTMISFLSLHSSFSPLHKCRETDLLCYVTKYSGATAMFSHGL